MTRTHQHTLNATERLLKLEASRATTKEIARKAGCAERMLYQHFVDKEEELATTESENL